MSAFYKKCSKCKEIKTVDQYHKNKTKTHGVDSDCKKCVSKRKSQKYKDTKSVGEISDIKFIGFVNGLRNLLLDNKEKGTDKHKLLLEANKFINKYGKNNLINYIVKEPSVFNFAYSATYIHFFLNVKLSEFNISCSELKKEHYMSCYSLFRHFYKIYPNNIKRALLYTLKTMEKTIDRANDYSRANKAYGRHRINYHKNFIKNMSKRYINEKWNAPFIEGFDHKLKDKYGICLDSFWCKRTLNLKNGLNYDISINNQTINNFVNIVR